MEGNIENRVLGQRLRRLQPRRPKLEWWDYDPGKGAGRGGSLTQSPRHTTAEPKPQLSVVDAGSGLAACMLHVVESRCLRQPVSAE